MVVDMKDMSKEELIEMNKRAIKQIKQLIKEKQELEAQVSQLTDSRSDK